MDVSTGTIAHGAMSEDAMREALPKRKFDHLEKLQKALENRLQSHEEIIREFYKAQVIHDNLAIGPKCIGVYITDKVSQEWRKSVENAMSNIERAAPGIDFHSTIIERDAKIKVDMLGSSDECRPYSKGNIWSDGLSRIFIHKDYATKRVNSMPELITRFGDQKVAEEKVMLRCCTHELFHALGFEHEHQVPGHTRDVQIAGTDDGSLRPLFGVMGITRFDRYSIMLYSGIPLTGDDPLETKTSYNLEMSELDKVVLNIVFPPCLRSETYNPVKVSLQTRDIYYCFRQVMESHNKPFDKITNGLCGYNRSNPKGPNCPACRTLKSGPTESGPVERWQGWSGMVYCGRGGCGPDNGPACEQCKTVLNM